MFSLIPCATTTFFAVSFVRSSICNSPYFDLPVVFGPLEPIPNSSAPLEVEPGVELLEVYHWQ